MTILAGVGLSTQKNSVLAAKEAVIQARQSLFGAAIDLAIVFTTIEFSNSPLIKTLSNYLPGAQIIGCSGLSIISNQGIFKHGLMTMLLSFPKDLYFHTGCVKNINEKTAQEAGKELGENLLSGLKNISRHISVIFSDGMVSSNSDLISGFQERLGISFPLVGAAASDNLAFKKTYVYFKQEALTNAASGVIFGGKLSFGLGTKHGWKCLGKPHTVTKSTGNIVNEIDNIPAVKIYEDYFAKDILQLKKELKRISILYPIGIHLTGEDEYLLRNISSIESDGSIIFQSSVPQGSQIRLMIGTKETCLEAVHQALDEAKKGLFGHPCNFVLIFDSVSRYILLGRQAKKELEIIKDTLGKNTPLMGIYTYGELSPLRAINYLGKTYFHNQTITILAAGG